MPAVTDGRAPEGEGDRPPPGAFRKNGGRVPEQRPQPDQEIRSEPEIIENFPP